MSQDIITFDTAKAEASGRKIRTEADKLKRMTDKLKRAVNETQTWWVGGSRNSFTRQANELVEQMYKAAGLVTELGDDMIAIAKAKKEEEARLKGELAGALAVEFGSGAMIGAGVPKEKNELKYISVAAGESGEVGIWQDPCTGEWFQNIIVSDPYPTLVTRKIDPTTIKYDSMSPEELLNLNTKNFSSRELELYNSQLEKRITEISELWRGKDITKVLASHRDLLVSYYETRYPEDAKKFAVLLKDLDMANDNIRENVRNIMYIAYTSPEPFHSAFFNTLEEAKMGHTEPYWKLFGGDQMEFGFYMPSFISTGTINIDLTSTDRYWACRVFFHEYGHYVDAYFDSASKSLAETIYNDVYDNLRDEIKKIRADENDINTILESLKKGGKELADPTLNSIREDIIKLYYDCNTRTGLLVGRENIVASDVYGGVTNNNIHGSYYHFPPTNNVFTDFSNSQYWYVLGISTGNQQKEYFAESFSNGMTQNNDALNNANLYFPNTNPMFNDLVDFLANK